MKCCVNFLGRLENVSHQRSAEQAVFSPQNCLFSGKLLDLQIRSHGKRQRTPYAIFLILPQYQRDSDCANILKLREPVTKLDQPLSVTTVSTSEKAGRNKCKTNFSLVKILKEIGQLVSVKAQLYFTETVLVRLSGGEDCKRAGASYVTRNMLVLNYIQYSCQIDKKPYALKCAVMYTFTKQ